MGEVLDTLDSLIDNIPAVWDQFLYEFSAQFQDSQKEGRAQQKLENLQMKFPDIDGYISQFEELACQANYYYPSYPLHQSQPNKQSPAPCVQ